jgi:hypothetical protein
MNLFSWMSGSAVSEADVRAEVWKLGARHLGEPLAGALAEIKAGGLSPERSQLLHACVKSLRKA